VPRAPLAPPPAPPPRRRSLHIRLPEIRWSEITPVGWAIIAFVVLTLLIIVLA